MDEFVAMLERAAAPPPEGLVDRVLDAVILKASPSEVAGEAPPTLLSLSARDGQPERRGRRGRAIGAIAAAAAAVVVALLVTHGREPVHPTSNIVVVDPGRLPARVMLGETDFVLTWLPPGFQMIASDGRSVTLSAAGWPDIVVSAKRGESTITEPFVTLGPLAQGHFDDAAGTLQWNASDWSFTIDASSPVRPALLGRLAVGIVLSDALTRPTDDASVAVKVPDVVGLDYREAQEQLESAGFEVRLGISSTAGSTVGVVERTTPAAGATVTRGATVALGVVGVPSQGPTGEIVLVSGDLPDAVGYEPFFHQPLGDGLFGSDEPDPIVFLHGELMGYGIGEAFEPLRRAAAAVEPAPEVPPDTTATATTTTSVAGTSSALPADVSTVDESAMGEVALNDLVGHEWLVRAGTSGISPWPDDAPLPWVEFDQAGTVTGFDGCATYAGTVSVAGSELTAAIDTTEPCDGVIGYGELHGGQISLVQDGTLRVSDTTAELADLTLVRVDSFPLAESLDGIYATTAEGLNVDFVARIHTVFFDRCTASWTLDDGTLTAHGADLSADCIDLGALSAPDQGLFDLLTSNTPVIARIDAVQQSVILMHGRSALRLYQLTQPSDASSFSLTQGAILGVVTGETVSPEAVIAAADPTLGPVEHDTGWYTDRAPRRGDGTDCLAGLDYRVLWWGDLSIAFRRVDQVSSIWAWSIGDRRASGWGDRRETYLPTNPAPTNLVTAGGLHVGSTVDGLHVQFGDSLASDADLARTYGDGTFMYDSTTLDSLRWGYIQHRNVVANVTVIDGVITGFGAAIHVC